MKSWKMQVRPIRERDWEACWQIQRSLHVADDIFSADTWLFICKNLTDSWVVVDDNDYPLAYWIGMLNINEHEPEPDIWCLAIDVCTHRDYRESGVMDLIMPVATQYHQKIYAFTEKGNIPAESIMTKWGFERKILENDKTDYWTYHRDENVT